MRPRLLDAAAPKPLPPPRTPAALAEQLRRMADSGALDLPLPGAGRTGDRWAALAALGRCDLALARLAEGHTDALAILAEAGRPAVPGALYGVWAARSGGTGATVAADRLTGTVRFCSGATVLDRALVAAVSEDGKGRLFDVDLTRPAIRPDPESWQAIGMDASDSLDVRFSDMRLTPELAVGGPDWYLSRRGFRLGSGGVAAVWLGGTAGVLDSVLALLRESTHVDPHQLAHLGALHAAVRAADALLGETARFVDDQPDANPDCAIRTAKSAVERAAWETRDRVPRITGPTPLCRDRGFPQRLADLEVYVRQHHAEKDLAALGEAVLATERR
ncbi:MAG TPA: acyl-CoA dehydrogenase family protein [Pseudonocardiaceae bacterium]|jgi:alkylation response protein AidB-like acyl-CoA dehydrogenase|nr:acyl-CoA dehydrogenase family protein [Pseudonocardiaceae bacterium]